MNALSFDGAVSVSRSVFHVCVYRMLSVLTIWEGFYSVSFLRNLDIQFLKTILKYLEV